MVHFGSFIVRDGSSQAQRHGKCTPRASAGLRRAGTIKNHERTIGGLSVQISHRYAIPCTAFSACAHFRHYFNLSYSSSVTGSSHSLDVSSPGTLNARCENQLSAAAPCQCFTLAGIWITVPGRISTAGFPSS